MVALYDGEIHYVDGWIGTILETLREVGLYDPSYIVFLSDHGEEFDDHGGWFHGLTLYGEMTAMPLLIKPPSGTGEAVRTSLSLDMVDLFPTLAELAGSSLEVDAQGKSYARRIDRLLGGEVVHETPTAYLERPPYLYSLQVGTWKIHQKSVYVDPPELRLFDLVTDPREQRDVSAVFPDTLARLRSLLTAFVESLDEAESSQDEGPMDPETRRALRALGYVD